MCACVCVCAKVQVFMISPDTKRRLVKTCYNLQPTVRPHIQLLPPAAYCSTTHPQLHAPTSFICQPCPFKHHLPIFHTPTSLACPLSSSTHPPAGVSRTHTFHTPPLQTQPAYLSHTHFCRLPAELFHTPTCWCFTHQLTSTHFY